MGRSVRVAECELRRVGVAGLAAARRLATRLHDEGRLAAPWTVATAADMIWALTSSELIERLVQERRWGRQRLAEHLGLVLRSSLVADPEQG